VTAFLAVQDKGGCPRDPSSPQKHWLSLNQREDMLKILKRLNTG